MPTLTLTSSPSTPSSPTWASALTPAEFEAHGLDSSCSVSCGVSLIELAAADDIDFAEVTRCIELLLSGPDLLHLGMPLALMADSPAL